MEKQEMATRITKPIMMRDKDPSIMEELEKFFGPDFKVDIPLFPDLLEHFWMFEAKCLKDPQYRKMFTDRQFKKRLSEIKKYCGDNIVDELAKLR
ncbi:MAG TPA: hypothetical protein VMW91_01600 [Desulfosporosinus sp.]|nr:hypothetical protein [Desulfosporosinus sp.]